MPRTVVAVAVAVGGRMPLRAPLDAAGAPAWSESPGAAPASVGDVGGSGRSPGGPCLPSPAACGALTAMLAGALFVAVTLSTAPGTIAVPPPPPVGWTAPESEIPEVANVQKRADGVAGFSKCPRRISPTCFSAKLRHQPQRVKIGCEQFTKYCLFDENGKFQEVSRCGQLYPLECEQSSAERQRSRGRGFPEPL